jgi:sporulation integral membrane protein YlbJ
MKKKLILLVLIIFTIFMLINYNITVSSVKYSYNLVMQHLFPTIIPFLLISNILIDYGFAEFCFKLFQKIFNKVFKINSYTSYVFILSFFTGSPSSSKYIKDLNDSALIDDLTVQKALLFTHFVNPIFLLNTVGLNTFNNKKIGLYLIIGLIASNIIIAVINRNKYISYNQELICINSNKSFIAILNESILKTFKTLILILGIITTIMITINILFTYIHTTNNIKVLVTGIFEITQGINLINTTSYSYELKILIVAFFIGFGGLSIHAQNFSIIDNKKIRYKPYFLARLLAGFILTVIMYFLI